MSLAVRSDEVDQRIVRGRSATIHHTFHSDGVATNPSPDSATVTITRDDGTVVVADGTATDTGTGTVSYTVAPADTATLDRWAVEWRATFGGQVQKFPEIVEVAGDLLFTLDQARATKPLDSTTAYPTDKIAAARTMVETALEELCGVAFVPRYGKLTISGDGSTILMLPPRTRTVRSVKRDGVAITDLSTVKVLPTGETYYPAGWTSGFANYEVVFEHGYDTPPPRVSEAALLWAKNFLVKGPIDDRMTGMSTADATFSLATPGIRGSYTGIPEVDAVVNQYNRNVAVA